MFQNLDYFFVSLSEILILLLFSFHNLSKAILVLAQEKSKNGYHRALLGHFVEGLYVLSNINNIKICAFCNGHNLDN